MSVDWGRLTPALRPGDWTCPTHGRIRPTTGGPVPTCPHCDDLAHQFRLTRAGGHQFVAPAPIHCSGPERHRAGEPGGQVGWTPCPCPPPHTHRGHHTWTCHCGAATHHPRLVDPSSVHTQASAT
ncbi:hypothetical protein AB0H28_29370 [Micromonospora sp. NPDC050980]|uniref:hypothetical protein n=1 Tax=Micromonospora sp. NPDC050980 TaxID=3155161 RepID=UPI0033BFC7B1